MELNRNQLARIGLNLGISDVVRKFRIKECVTLYPLLNLQIWIDLDYRIKINYTKYRMGPKSI